jgi:hypothetical protein
LTNSRREVRMLPPLRGCYERVSTNAISEDLAPVGPAQERKFFANLRRACLYALEREF